MTERLKVDILQVVVVVGETGSGKSTQLPQYSGLQFADAALKDVEYAGRVSKAIKSIAMWVQAVYEYGS